MNETPNVIVKFESMESIGMKVGEVHIKHIIDAVRANATNYEALGDIRQALVFTLMEIDHLQGQIKYGPIDRKGEVLS